MKNNNSSIKTVVAVGIGAALFFVLGRFVAIPSPVPNTNISLQYAVLALLAAMYGPVAGGLIGFIGHTLIDLSWGGSPWWSWVIASAFVGVVVGLFAKKLDLQEGEFGKKQMAAFTAANIVAHLLACAGHPDLRRAGQEGLRAGCVRRCLQHHHRSGGGRSAGAGLYQDHRQEGLARSGVIFGWNPQPFLRPSRRKGFLFEQLR